MARVEQTETPAQLADRNASAPKGRKDKVVRRELCSVKSAGTRTFGVIDVGARGDGDGSGPHGGDGIYAPLAAEVDGGAGAGAGQYLYAICEVPVTFTAAADEGAAADDDAAAHRGFARFGVVLADCGSGDVRFAEFVDDRTRSRLRTLMTRCPPAEVLYERDPAPAAGAGAGSSSSSSSAAKSAGGLVGGRRPGLSDATKRVLASGAALTAVKSPLAPGAEFLPAAETHDEVLMLPYTKPAAVAAARDAGAAVVPALPNAVGRALATDPHDVAMRDYFAVEADDVPSSAGSAGAGAGSSSSSAAGGGAPSPAAVAARFRGCAVVRCPDGKTRALPRVLADVMERARADGFVTPPSVPLTHGAAVEGRDVPPSSLALSAFGAVVWYLRRALVDHAVLSMRRFSTYAHADGHEGSLATSSLEAALAGAATAPSSSAAAAAASSEGGDVDMADGSTGGGELPPRGEGTGVPHMQLDGAALANLEVLENSDTGGRAGTLIRALDTTVTTFGRRRFRQWLCAPLLRPQDIEDRCVAVADGREVGRWQ